MQSCRKCCTLAYSEIPGLPVKCNTAWNATWFVEKIDVGVLKLQTVDLNNVEFDEKALGTNWTCEGVDVWNLHIAIHGLVWYYFRENGFTFRGSNSVKIISFLFWKRVRFWKEGRNLLTLDPFSKEDWCARKQAGSHKSWPTCQKCLKIYQLYPLQLNTKVRIV